MIITPIKCDLEDLGIGISTGPRSKGLHISDVYGALFQELEPKRFDKNRPLDPLRLELGLEFELILEEALRNRLTNAGERPGEMVTEEGIFYSPDLVIFNGVTRVGEIKLTFMSCREMPTERTTAGFPPKFDKWMVQVKAYCRCLETRYARLYALFVCGDYNKTTGMAPQFRAWDLEFSQRELDENWSMLMMFAKDAGMLKKGWKR